MAIQYRDNASKLHRLVGDTLQNSAIFGGYEIVQEYSASLVHPRLSPRLHFDWAIPRLRLVIECHGEQHYRPVNFGGRDYEMAVESHNETKRRDRIKREGALYAGWAYIEVPYNAKVTEDFLYEKWLLAKQEAESYNEVVDKPVLKERSEFEKRRLELARQARKERYQRAKEWKKEHGS